MNTYLYRKQGSNTKLRL